MSPTVDTSLDKLIGVQVLAFPGHGFPEPGTASIFLQFADGSTLRAEYWRLIIAGRASTTSFDHEQIYGLPAKIDAIAELQKRLDESVVLGARLDPETGDLIFVFTPDVKLQVLNVTGYEVYEIRFPDGTGNYSNYLK